MSGAGESVVCVLLLTLGNLYTAGQDVELPMSFEVRAGDEGQCRGDGVESFTGSTWGMASGTPVLLRPGVCLVMGFAIASDHTGKIGVCCFGLASQAGS